MVLFLSSKARRRERERKRKKDQSFSRFVRRATWPLFLEILLSNDLRRLLLSRRETLHEGTRCRNFDYTGVSESSLIKVTSNEERNARERRLFPLLFIQDLFSPHSKFDSTKVATLCLFNYPAESRIRVLPFSFSAVNFPSLTSLEQALCIETPSLVSVSARGSECLAF